MTSSISSLKNSCTGRWSTGPAGYCGLTSRVGEMVVAWTRRVMVPMLRMMLSLRVASDESAVKVSGRNVSRRSSACEGSHPVSSVRRGSRRVGCDEALALLVCVPCICHTRSGSSCASPASGPLRLKLWLANLRPPVRVQRTTISSPAEREPAPSPDGLTLGHPHSPPPPDHASSPPSPACNTH